MKIKYAKSKYGRMEFRYTEMKSQRCTGKEWDRAVVEALLNGKVIGSLFIDYLTKENFDKFFNGRIERFLACATGGQLQWGIKNQDSKNIVRALSDILKEKPSVEMIEYKTDLPDEWWIKKYNELIQKCNKKFDLSFKKFYDFWVNKPLIDYIEVNEQYREGGIGFGLYIAGAKWMEEKGMALYAGNYRSSQALKAWERMRRKGLPVKDKKYKQGTRSYIDYTKNR